MLEKERARENSIRNEMEQMANNIKNKMKQLNRVRQETTENTKSYRDMADSMIEKLDRRRESHALDNLQN